jgi:integrase
MASIDKVSGGHRAQIKIKVGGEVVRDSRTFATKSAATAWAVDRERELRIEKVTGVVPGKTFGDACDRYEVDVSAAKRGYRWEALRIAAFKRQVINKKQLGTYRLDDLTPDLIGKWRDIRLDSVSGATVNREFNLLSHILSTARDEWRWLAESPTTKVRRPKDSAHRDRLPTLREVEAITTYCGFDETSVTKKIQAVAVAFLFSIETAMRQGEVCKITPRMVDGSVVKLPKEICKNGHKRDVPMSVRARELLGFLPMPETDDTPYFMLKADSMSVMFGKVCAACMIEDLHFHDSRHEAITRLAKKLHVLDLARMTGHRDLKQLQVYYNESAHSIAALLG